MNNQPDDLAALHLPNLSLDPVEEALSHLTHLSKERRKKAALQLLVAKSKKEARPHQLGWRKRTMCCLPRRRSSMSLKSLPIPPIPEEIARVARAVFPHGTVFMQVRDTASDHLH
jgi:hypothetical protein